ncbi:MAG TPA: IPT/TIG domain-containing protein [Planctomycetota bacterium]|nr:IPT/TIG domain-containing protein [Planctomycetota bacterium]
MRHSFQIVLLLSLTLTSAARAIDINFQGRLYSVTTVPLANNVNVAEVTDLIFVTSSGQKFLALPQFNAFRGSFDPVNERFYVVEFGGLNPSGRILAFKSLDGTLIKLDGTLQGTMVLSPGFDSNPLEIISRPLAIPGTAPATDVCIVDDASFGYRTDGPVVATDPAVYTFTRQSPNTVTQSFKVVPRNTSLPLIEFDRLRGTYLLLHVGINAASNTDVTTSLNNRVSAYTPAGELVSEFGINPQVNTAFATLGGVPAGMAVDPSTGTIYLLDTAGRQIFVITPRIPTITSINPNKSGQAGGIQVTVTGVNLPSDAQLFIGGIAATNVSVAANGTSITGTVPPHAAGLVNVTVTGTDIPAGSPLTLINAFEYVNTPPVAVLDASPTAGPPPLTVLFNTAASNDPDGRIVERTILFGDGGSFTFPAGSVSTVTSNEYTAAGTYIATLTVKDELGATSTAKVTIVVGSSDLVVRNLSFSVTEKKNPEDTSRDTFKLKGEFVLPDDTDLSDALMTLAFLKPEASSLELAPCTDPGEVLQATNAFKVARTAATGEAIGGRYCAEINENQQVDLIPLKFKFRPLNRRGFLPNTQSFSLTSSQFELRAALTAAGLSLAPGKSLGTFTLILTFETADGQLLQYRKQIVVDVKTGKSSTAKLTRR